MSNPTVMFKIAMPVDGEGVENLNDKKYAQAIYNYVKDAFGDGVKVSVEVFQHNGTGVDTVQVGNATQDEEYRLRERAEMLMPEAVSEAFNDPDNYD